VDSPPPTPCTKFWSETFALPAPIRRYCKISYIQESNVTILLLRAVAYNDGANFLHTNCGASTAFRTALGPTQPPIQCLPLLKPCKHPDRFIEFCSGHGCLSVFRFCCTVLYWSLSKYAYRLSEKDVGKVYKCSNKNQYSDFATDWTTGVQFPAGAMIRFFVFSTASRQVLVPPSLLSNGCRGLLFRG
jgi:hypothetical protein